MYIHDIATIDKKVFKITSTHHQAAYPYNIPTEDYELIGWTENISRFHLGGNNEELNPGKEVEIIYYPKTNDLGIQGHPEMMPKTDIHNYLNELINIKLFKNSNFSLENNTVK